MLAKMVQLRCGFKGWICGKSRGDNVRNEWNVWNDGVAPTGNKMKEKSVEIFWAHTI